MDKRCEITGNRPHRHPIGIHTWPTSEEERQELAEWVLDMVDDMVENSLRFIEEELSELEPRQRRRLLGRFRRQLVSRWAQWVLGLYASGAHFPSLPNLKEEADGYLRAHFVLPYMDVPVPYRNPDQYRDPAR